MVEVVTLIDSDDEPTSLNNSSLCKSASLNKAPPSYNVSLIRPSLKTASPRNASTSDTPLSDTPLSNTPAACEAAYSYLVARISDLGGGGSQFKSLIGGLTSVKETCSRDYLTSLEFISDVSAATYGLTSVNMVERIRALSVKMFTNRPDRTPSKPAPLPTEPSTKRRRLQAPRQPSPVRIIIPESVRESREAAATYPNVTAGMVGVTVTGQSCVVASAPRPTQALRTVQSSSSTRPKPSLVPDKPYRTKPSSQHKIPVIRESSTTLNISDTPLSTQNSNQQIISHKLSALKTRWESEPDVLFAVTSFGFHITSAPLTSACKAELAIFFDTLSVLSSAYLVLLKLRTLLGLEYFTQISPVYVTPEEWFAAHYQRTKYALGDFVAWVMFKLLLGKALPKDKSAMVGLLTAKFRRGSNVEKGQVLARISKVKLCEEEKEIGDKSYAASILCCLGDCMELLIRGASAERSGENSNKKRKEPTKSCDPNKKKNEPSCEPIVIDIENEVESSGTSESSGTRKRRRSGSSNSTDDKGSSSDTSIVKPLTGKDRSSSRADSNRSLKITSDSEPSKASNSEGLESSGVLKPSRDHDDKCKLTAIAEELLLLVSSNKPDVSTRAANSASDSGLDNVPDSTNTSETVRNTDNASACDDEQTPDSAKISYGEHISVALDNASDIAPPDIANTSEAVINSDNASASDNEKTPDSANISDSEQISAAATISDIASKSDIVNISTATEETLDTTKTSEKVETLVSPEKEESAKTEDDSAKSPEEKLAIESEETPSSAGVTATATPAEVDTEEEMSVVSNETGVVEEEGMDEEKMDVSDDAPTKSLSDSELVVMDDTPIEPVKSLSESVVVMDDTPIEPVIMDDVTEVAGPASLNSESSVKETVTPSKSHVIFDELQEIAPVEAQSAIIPPENPFLDLIADLTGTKSTKTVRAGSSLLVEKVQVVTEPSSKNTRVPDTVTKTNETDENETVTISDSLESKVNETVTISDSLGSNGNETVTISDSLGSKVNETVTISDSLDPVGETSHETVTVSDEEEVPEVEDCRKIRDLSQRTRSVEILDDCMITSVKQTNVQYVEVDLNKKPIRTVGKAAAVAPSEEAVTQDTEQDTQAPDQVGSEVRSPKKRLSLKPVVRTETTGQSSGSSSVASDQKKRLPLKLVNSVTAQPKKRLSLKPVNTDQSGKQPKRATPSSVTSLSRDPFSTEAGPSRITLNSDDDDEESESEEDPDVDEDAADYREAVAKIETLSRKLVRIARRIKAVQEADIAEEEMDKWGNLYVQESKLKKKHGKVLAELEGVQGQLKVHYHFKVKVNCGIPILSKFVQDRLNARQKFPDIEDLRRLIERGLKVNGMTMKKPKVKAIAKQILLDAGTQIQNHRKNELRLDGGFHLMDKVDVTQDPAKADPELRKKLKRNRNLAQKELKDIQTKFDEEQLKKELLDEDIFDDGTKEEEEDGEEENSESESEGSEKESESESGRGSGSSKGSESNNGSETDK